jgi:hypothetical protein
MMIGVVRDVTIVWSRGGWNIELKGATIDDGTIARGEQKVTLMASTDNLPEAKPPPPAEPGAADEDTEGHAWMNDNETVVEDDRD